MNALSPFSVFRSPVSIFTVFLLSTVVAQTPERLRLVHADELENITDPGGKAVQYLRGNVKFQKGETILSSARAYYRQREATASFVGSVLMKRGEQTLTVDSMMFDSNRDRVTGYGNVQFDDPEYHLESDSLTYYLDPDSGIASGGVRFVQKNQTITSRQLTYQKREGDEAASYTAEGDVVILEENRRATCGKSIYDASKNFSILLDNPVVVQDRQTLAGSEIRLYYENESLRRVVIPDKSHIRYATRGKVPIGDRNPHPDTSQFRIEEFTNEMNGQRLEAYLVDGSLDSVRLEGMATTLYHLFSGGSSGEDSVYQGKNFASGDTITLRFRPAKQSLREGGQADSARQPAGELESVRLVGGSRGEYHPHESSKGITAPVFYRADRIDYDIPRETTNLYGKAQIDYQTTRLKAGYVSVTWNDNLLKALPSEDPAAQVSPDDLPAVMEKGRNPMIGRSLAYNLSTGRGKVAEGKTSMQDGYYKGEEIRNRTEDVFFIERSTYTTCDLDPRPHFHFESRRMKMIIKDKIIARPVILYIAGIPVFGLPFGVFPDQSGQRHSGWIMPSYGESRTQGQYLKGLSYFWAVNEHLNSQFILDFYDKQGIVLSNRSDYFKRYAFRGGLSLRYNRKVGTQDIADLVGNPNSVDWSLSWVHNQVLRNDQKFGVDASYYSSNDFNRRLGIERETRLQQTAISRASYTKRWDGPGISLAANLSENRNLMAGEKIDSTSIYYSPPSRAGERIRQSLFVLPTVTLRKGKSQLFGGEGPGWYWDYTGTLRNQGETFYESDEGDTTGSYVWGNKLQQKFGNRWVHSISLTGSRRLFDHIALNQSLSFQEKWIDRYFDASTVDTLGQFEDRKEVRGFRARHEFSFSMGANTKLYGIFPIRIGTLRAIRHTLSPSVSFSFVPDYSKRLFGYDFGYVKKLPDDLGQTHLFDPFSGTEIGATPTIERRSLNIQLQNSFQAKVREGDKERNTTTFLSWNVSTGYNFVADRFNWSKIRSSIRTDLPRLFSLDITMLHDFYDVEVSDGSPRRADRLVTGRWGLPAPRLTSVSASTGFQITGKPWRPKGAKPVPVDTTVVDTLFGQGDLTGIGLDQGEEIKKSTTGAGNLWRAGLNFSYTINRENPLSPRDNFWMALNMTLNATKNWRVQYSARMDLLERSVTSHDFRVYRDLHCWELVFTWTPGGFGQGYYLRINVKAPSLNDLKVESRAGRYNIAGY